MIDSAASTGSDEPDGDPVGTVGSIRTAHLERVESYRRLVEQRGWLFGPPTPPLPLASLLDHLTGAQLESLGNTDAA